MGWGAASGTHQICGLKDGSACGESELEGLKGKSSKQAGEPCSVQAGVLVAGGWRQADVTNRY